jgi:predicted ATPase/DNA-binding SARP family transcriptional activator
MATSVDGDAPSGSAIDLRIRDLGPLVVERGGESRRVPAGRLAGALALFVIHAGRRVGNDALVEAMWGADAAPRSASTMDSHVFRLRQVLEPGRRSGEPSTTLVREAHGHRLVVSTDQVDSLRFVRLAADGADLLAQGAPERALRRTREALTSWRGRPFGNAADEPWAAAAVGRLEELFGQVRETHIGALLATGAPDEALAELESALADHPLRERLWAHRMTAYRHSGRRADALRAYGQAREILVEELGIDPGPELRALHAALLAEEDPAPPTPTPRPTVSPEAVHLPVPRHRMLGREKETAELTGLVASHPLTTVTGPAGCGKTRLAVEAAGLVAAAFPDGVWFVDLTSATPDRVLDTVCTAVELPVSAAGSALRGLQRFVRDRRLLLVLDNCEHVLDAAAELVEQLLADGPELAVLATSREPLEVADERVHLLDPLATAPAADLFLERLDAVAGRAAEHGFEHTVDEASAATEIAAAVDGLPLALELAAGRARAYSLPEIVAQVRADASNLSRIGRGRASHHSTVRGAIDTSYRALPEPEAALHRAVAVVPGAFTVDLAAGLTGMGPSNTVDALAGLVHRSMLTSLGPLRPGGRSRFAQLATVRGHALHQVEHGGADARDAWVERLVREHPGLGSPRVASWYRALEDDLAALRATLQHTLIDAPSATGIALVVRLGQYWAFHDLVVEGLNWDRAAVAACERDPALGTAADRALVRVWVGGVLTMHRPEEGRRLVRLGMAEARAAAPDDVARVCIELAVITGAVFRSRDVELLSEIAATVRELGADDPALDVVVRHAEIIVPLVTSPSPDLVSRLTALYADARAEDNLHTAWVSAVAAAQVLLVLGRPVEALEWARACITACVELGLKDSTFPVEVLGCALALTGDNAAAARVFALAETSNARGGMPWPTTEITARLVEAVSTALGRTGREQARAEAAHLTLADLVAISGG